ncbi:hypothetical protein C1645_838193 [Glomus cerebriforme]|uniref:Uncharacterized protein n=1 Tax=Glomus cerebriforme TaxID=658196 RepID=A0A397SE79_9GLOM|nr:hypothetical protein C1645_838193 [Glomus cerebriforme]
MPNPLSHCLFQEYLPTQLYQQGVERLIACYHNGLERIKAVYQQEVLEIEYRNTQDISQSGSNISAHSLNDLKLPQ